MVLGAKQREASIDGEVTGAFAPVGRELARQLAQAPGTGGAVCVYHHGRPVVDAYGGTRNARGEPWRAETLTTVFSTGKGVASTLMHTLVDAGLARYDDTVAQHWPEFAQAGKQRITIRDVLSHRAGLHRLSDMIDDFWQVLEFDAMAQRIARATPARLPEGGSGYHGITYSWLLGELLRRIGKKSVAELLRERLVEPLQLDGAYFGAPEHELARCAELHSARELMTIGHHALGFAHPFIRALSRGRVSLDDVRAALVLRASGVMSWNDRRLRLACILSSTGLFTARSLARVYAMLAQGGTLDGVSVLSPTTVAALQEVQGRGHDCVMGLSPQWRLGYHGIQAGGAFVPGAFGHCGYRGMGAFADPNRSLAFAYVHNAKAGMRPMGEGRFQQLVRVALRCADETMQRA